MLKTTATALLLLGCLFASPAQALPITFDTLLSELVDLKALAASPSPPYLTKQFSSYDQRSTDPTVLTDENWFANGDRGQYLRTDDRNGAPEYVLMDAEGPGAVVRIWSANPDDAGILRVYLDGASDPVIETPLSDYLGGKNPISPEPISGVRGLGWNAYLPIPYSTHCKITTSKPDFYYHINYRTYAVGAEVKTYTPEQSQAAKARYAEVTAILDAPAAHRPDYIAATPDMGFEGEVRGEEETVLMVINGAAAIGQITCKIEAEDLEAALRGAVLRIYFDGEDIPRVEAPLGDFFGTAPGIQPFASLPCGVLEDGTLYSRWVIPFKSEAALVLTNTTKQTLNLKLTATTMPHVWDENSLYFHAKWRAGHDIPTRPRQDWNYLTATGRGRFVGAMLHISNPVIGWWGEGDEKIYVDGETFPSHFGTGTEDYFGYAWCDNQTFTHAFHNQPRCDGPGNYGHSCVSRFHIIDSIPFNKGFKFDMEVWHWENCTIDQSVVSYWYADVGSLNNVPAPTPETLIIPTIPPLPEPMRVAGALEGEKLTIVEATGGQHMVQKNPHWGWSNSEQLWWRDAKPGDRLTVAFPVNKTGVYEVRAVFTKAIDFGIANILLNGETVQKNIDFFNDGVIPTPEISLATLELTEGDQQLTIEITGKNPKALPAHMAGIDYILLRPAAGRLEGETLPVLSKSAGNTSIQTSRDYGWSANKQVWWTDAKPGDSLSIGFDAPAEGKYTLKAVFTLAHDYGIFDFAINGVTVQEDVDLYDPGVISGPELTLGTIALKKGQNTFDIKIAGTNELADPVEYMFGLDYLQLEPAE